MSMGERIIPPAGRRRDQNWPITDEQKRDLGVTSVEAEEIINNVSDVGTNTDDWGPEESISITESQNVVSVIDSPRNPEEAHDNELNNEAEVRCFIQRQSAVEESECSQESEKTTKKTSVLDRLHHQGKQLTKIPISTNSKIILHKADIQKISSKSTTHLQDKQPGTKHTGKPTMFLPHFCCPHHISIQNTVSVFDRLYSKRKQFNSKQLTDTERRERYIQKQREEIRKKLAARKLENASFSSEIQRRLNHSINQSTPTKPRESIGHELEEESAGSNLATMQGCSFWNDERLYEETLRSEKSAHYDDDDD